MNIILNAQHEQWVKTKVDSGLYASANELMGEALSLLEARDKLQELKTQDLRRKIQQGITSGEASPLNFEEIKARGRKRLEAKHKAE